MREFVGVGEKETLTHSVAQTEEGAVFIRERGDDEAELSVDPVEGVEVEEWMDRGWEGGHIRRRGGIRS